MSRFVFAPILAAVALAACGGSDFRPVITGLDPPNGASNVDQSITPKMTLASGVAVDLSKGDGRFVLYNVTSGAHSAIAGQIGITGTQLTYEPTDPLPADSDFELVMKHETVKADDKLLDIDASEFEEPITWPYVWRFTTRSLAQVRAVYLDSGRVFVHFSQAMEQVATTVKSFTVFDLSSQPVPITKLVWTADGIVRLELGAPLDRTGLYTLVVHSDAQAADGSLLDGDGNGKAGEPNDEFSVQFTGSQDIVKSRLPDA